MKKLIFIFIFISLHLTFNLSYADSSNIVNGVAVSSDSPIAKTTVMVLGKYQRFSYTCSGIIISKKIILTAAHCLGPYESAALSVFFGVNKNKNGITVNVTKHIRPDNYDEKRVYDRNDIALLLLDKEIPNGFEAVKLGSEVDVLNSEDMVTLAGYGINVVSMPSKGDGGIGILRSVEQNIINPNYGSTEILINIKNKGTCSGDSGGPAFIKKDNEFILVGNASRMTDKDIVPGSKPTQYACSEEIVYTNILKQLDWIKAGMLIINQ
jgi:secreted trypsin-like serine protease